MIKNNQTLSLSVVIPVYNEQQTIKTVIHTVSNSKIVNEIVIVNYNIWNELSLFISFK